MIPALIILALLVTVGTILYLLDRRNAPATSAPESQEKTTADQCTADCCGINEVCPSEMLLANASKPPVYYDDEELDSFASRRADGYTAEEIEQFRDVLYTLQPADLMGWERSLKRRGIIMPEPIHDEFLMLYNERPTPHA